VDINVFIENDILFFDYGYVRVGDINTLKAELEGYIRDLPTPFQTISLYDRAIEKNSLPVPEDTDRINSFANFLEKSGRDLSIWVISEQNLLHKSLLSIAQNKEFVRVARSIDEAKKIIEEHRINTMGIG
jgi:hypothetical protein